MSTLQKWIVAIFILLYAYASTLSTIHSVDFFKLANPTWLAISMSIAFEIGAAACLAAILMLDKTIKWMVWTLFCLVTSVQIMGNMYYAYAHISEFSMWVELMGLSDQEPMLQKRILSILTGAILPVVALGFIKSLSDLLKSSSEPVQNVAFEETSNENAISHSKKEEPLSDVLSETESIEQKNEPQVELSPDILPISDVEDMRRGSL